MRRLPCLEIALLAAACGGGGGAAPPPAQQAAGIGGSAVEFAPTATTALLELQLSGELDGAVLCELGMELPEGVVLVANGTPTPRQVLTTVDAFASGSSLRLLAGDARNADAVGLRTGPLVAVPLALTLPRRTGTKQIVLRDFRLARGNGTAVPVQTGPTAVAITIR